MINVINYRYSRKPRLDPKFLYSNSILNISYRGYSIIGETPLKSTLDIHKFSDLLSVYKVILFYLDRYFGPGRCNSQVIDITNGFIDDLPILSNYLNLCWGNKKVFLLYRTKKLWCDTLKIPYDLCFDFDISHEDIHGSMSDMTNYVLAFRDINNGNRGYEFSNCGYVGLHYAYDFYEGWSGDSLDSLILVKTKEGESKFLNVNLLVIDPEFFEDDEEIFDFPIRPRKDLPMLNASIFPIHNYEALSPVVKELPII